MKMLQQVLYTKVKERKIEIDSQVLEAKAQLKKLDEETAKLISEYADLIDEMDAKKKEEPKKPKGLEPGTLSRGAGMEKPLAKHNIQKISAEHCQTCIDALSDGKHMLSLKKSKIPAALGVNSGDNQFVKVWEDLLKLKGTSRKLRSV